MWNILGNFYIVHKVFFMGNKSKKKKIIFEPPNKILFLKTLRSVFKNFFQKEFWKLFFKNRAKLAFGFVA